MGRLEEVAERDGWRCWLCDEPVDPHQSVNDPRGPSVDAVVTKAKAKAKGAPAERLAHRACNTGKGAVTPVVPWPSHLFVTDPAVILASVDRLERKGGREVMARCMTRPDAQATAAWLVDRISRLRPGLEVRSEIDTFSGQFLVALRV
jgi:hypothetical protein